MSSFRTRTAPGSSRPGAPLRVLVIPASPAPVDGHPEPEADRVLRLVAVTDRLRPSVHRLRGGPGRRLADAARLVSVLRSLDPDVLLAEGATAAAVAVGAGTITGHRVVVVRDADDPALPARLSRRAAAVLTSSPLAGSDDDSDRLRIPRGDTGPQVHEVAHRLAGVLAEVVGRPGAGIDPATAPPMSVVVPVYREGALVDDLVQALLPQLREDDELVVVDDGSPDDTGERAEQAAARDPRVRAVRRPQNAGAGAARNAGVAVSRHAHIAFTDAGCHWGVGYLDGMRTPFAEALPPDLVAGAYRVSRRSVFEAASAVGCYPDVAEVRRAGPVTTAWSVLFGRRFDPTRPAGRSVAVRRSALEAVGGWPEHIRVHEDLDLSRSIAERGLRCVLTTDADLVWDQAGVRGTARMYVRYGRGDAEAADRQALARDLGRAVAYLVGIVGLGAGGPRMRAALAVGGVAYVWVPLARARHEERPLVTAVLAPAVIVAKDLAKVWGVLSVLTERASRRARARRRTHPGGLAGRTGPTP
ncbi:glycosyltransferase [Geodermatophilus amargosae]|uniref:glycosyltransferase n=1 Tax=Geodermatophilus amargosae TaxID=1296565 RepID=UPI0015874B1E|nr:glycosyltransferase [Geodermatophilus amargosae]